MIRSHEVRVTMPYLAKVSVNAAYKRNSPRYGKRKEVKEWIDLLHIILRNEIGQSDPPIDAIQLDITIERTKKPGRNPDPSNFRKIPQDEIAKFFGVDDNIFWGVDHLIEDGEQDNIHFDIRWKTKERVYIIGSGSQFHSGPLSEEMRRRWALHDYCIGFGSAFCLICEHSDFCPQKVGLPFSPEVLYQLPCKTCNVANCPCRGEDEDYEDRKRRIELWWEAHK